MRQWWNAIARLRLKPSRCLSLVQRIALYEKQLRWRKSLFRHRREIAYNACLALIDVRRDLLWPELNPMLRVSPQPEPVISQQDEKVEDPDLYERIVSNMLSRATVKRSSSLWSFNGSSWDRVRTVEYDPFGSGDHVPIAGRFRLGSGDLPPRALP